LKENNLNPINLPEGKLIDNMKIIFLQALSLSILVGTIVGLISIFQNQYLNHSFYYIAFDELTDAIKRHLYVFMF